MPKAEFTTNMNSISQNDTVKFINSSLNATSYLWHFTGGTPEYSNKKIQWLFIKEMDALLFRLKYLMNMEAIASKKIV